MPLESPLVTSGRWLRAVIFSTVMTVLAMTAHLAAGGRLPGLGLTVLAGLLGCCLTFPLTRRDRSVSLVITTAVAAQAALHLVFALPMAGMASTAAVGGQVGKGGQMSMPGGTAGIGVAQAWAAFTTDSPAPAMLAAHLVAATVLAIGLRRGERALLDLAASLRTFFGVLVAVVTGRLDPALTGSQSPVRHTFDVVGLAGTLLGSDQWGRAPPVMRTR